MKEFIYKNLKSFLVLGIFFLSFFLFTTDTLAANKYWVGADGANFNTASSWSSTDPTSCSDNVTATTTPGSSDVAIFDADCDSSTTISANWAVSAVTIASGYTGIITQNTATTWTIYNNFTNSATASTYSGSGTATITLDSSPGNKTITTGGITFNNLLLYFSNRYSSFTSSLTDSFTVSGNLSVQAGYENAWIVWSAPSAVTITLQGNYNQSGSGTGDLTFGSNLTLDMTGDSKTFTVTGGNFNANLNFTGTGITRVSKGGSSGGGTATINPTSGIVALSGNSNFYTLIIKNGKTLDASPNDGVNSYNMTLYGNLTNESGAIFIGRSGTVTLDSSVSQTTTTGGITFSNLSLYNSYRFTSITRSFTDSFTVSGNISVQANWENASIVWSAPSAVTITLQGNYNQAFSGTGSLTFGNSNLTIDMTGDSKTFTVTGGNFNANLNFTGTGITRVSKGGSSGGGTATVNLDANSSISLSGASTFYVLNCATGTLDLNGQNLTANSTFTTRQNGILKLKGSESSVSTPTLNTGSTVWYYGTTTVGTIKNWAYKNLTINSASTTNVFSFPSNISATTTNITSGILYSAGYNFTSVYFANDSIFRLKGSETITITYPDTDSGTFEYVGDGDGIADTYTVAPFPYYNLKINSTDVADVFVGNTVSLTMTKQNSGNYVFDKGAAGKFDSSHASYPFVLKDNGIYKMWYAGNNATIWAGIGYATSSDGLTWTRQNSGNAVLAVTAGKFDSNGVLAPAIIKDGSIYKMWYSGYNATIWAGIGYATSSDGLTWTKQNSGNVVLAPGSAGAWDAPQLYIASVIKDGSVYKMWYGGHNGTNIKIGYATSSDGLTWTKYANNPVMTISAGKFDSTHVYTPNVIYDGTKYIMFYAGNNTTIWGGIGYALSFDGINWTKQNSGNPFLTNGIAGTFDTQAMYGPTAIFENNQYKVWYTGQNTNLRIGLAYSNTLTTSSSTLVNLIVNNGTYYPPSIINMSGSLTQTGGSINAVSTALNLVGANQTISLNATTTFASLTKTLGVGSTTNQTLTFSNSSTTPLIITGTTTLSGVAGDGLTLKLRSVASSTPWYFDPQAITNGRIFSYIDVQDSTNINVTEIDSSSITGFVDSGNNIGWGLESSSIIVGKQGVQIATTTIPATNVDLGGAFTFVKESGNDTITSITLTQNGTLDDSYLENLELYYEATTTCASVKPGDATLFGTSTAFVNNRSTTTGSLTVGTDNVCLYAVYDISGELTATSTGQTIDLQISNPAVDVIADVGAPTASAPVNIYRNTIIYNSGIQSLISLHVQDPVKDPTVFYLQNYIVWKKEGDGEPYRISNPDLKIYELNFTNLSGADGILKYVKNEIVTSSVGLGEESAFPVVTRSLQTTSGVLTQYRGD